MTLLTYRYKAEPSAGQHPALRSARWYCMRLRNAALQERIESYRVAKRIAIKAGRDKPAPADWIAARQEEIADFLRWQTAGEANLRRRHEQAEDLRCAELTKAIAAGDPKADPANLTRRPWRAKTAEDFGRGISLQDQQRRLIEIRADEPEGLGGVPRSVLREQLVIVDEAMKAFYRRLAAGEKTGFPRFKRFERVRSLESPMGEGISFEQTEELEAGPDGQKSGRMISSCRLKSMIWEGGIKVSMHRPMPSDVRRVTLTYDGRFWWASFLVRIPDTHRPHARLGEVRGYDLGVERLVTDDLGDWIENPRFERAGALEIAGANRRLARCKQRSTAQRNAKRALAAAHRRQANRRRHHAHVVAKRLACAAETSVFEDLNHANMRRSASGSIEEPGTNVAQKRGLNRALSDAAFGRIVDNTRRKAEKAGGRVLLVDPRNTSQDCSGCGTKVPKPLRQRWHDCPQCGLSLHRDHNAAVNVRDRGNAILRTPDGKPGVRPGRGQGGTGRHRASDPQKAGSNVARPLPTVPPPAAEG